MATHCGEYIMLQKSCTLYLFFELHPMKLKKEKKKERKKDAMH
jgi:hypothetical protein